MDDPRRLRGGEVILRGRGEVRTSYGFVCRRIVGGLGVPAGEIESLPA